MILLTAATEMNPRQTEIFSVCENYFFAHENPQQVIKNARFFREGYDAFGLDETQLEVLRDNILGKFEPSVSEIAGLAWHFFATGKYEFGLLAIMLLKKNRPKFDRTVFEELRRCLDRGVHNWSLADLIATKLTPVLLELEVASMADFAEWLISPSRWTRRVAAVTMLWQIGKLPTAELLDFLEPLMQDADRNVQQGVGWLLRELWNDNPEEVEAYLLKHKETAPRAIIQSATEKMAKETKKVFFRGGIGWNNSAEDTPEGQTEQPPRFKRPNPRRGNRPHAKPGQQNKNAPAPRQEPAKQGNHPARQAARPNAKIKPRRPHYRKSVPNREDNNE